MQLAKSYGRYAYKKAYPIVKKRARVYVPAVKQLYSDISYLKGIINSEPKQHYVTAANNCDYAGVVISLSDIPQGDTSASRDGNRVLPRYLKLRFHVNKNMTGGAATHLTVRYILFRWWGESPNAVGINPVPADILGSLSTGYAPLSPLQNAIVGPRGDRNRRIEVHRTGMVTLDQVSRTCIDFDDNIEINGSRSAKKEHMEYFNATTAPPTSGGFFLMFVTDNATGTEMSYTIYSTLTYYDN